MTKAQKQLSLQVGNLHRYIKHMGVSLCRPIGFVFGVTKYRSVDVSEFNVQLAQCLDDRHHALLDIAVDDRLVCEALLLRIALLVDNPLLNNQLNALTSENIKHIKCFLFVKQTSSVI